MSRFKRSRVAAALIVASVGASEGTVQYAYRDPGTGGKPWTICTGATHYEDGSEVKPGDYRTLDQCRSLLLHDSELFADKVEGCTDPAVLAAMPDKRYVAFVSFAFNLGAGTYCKSVAPLVNAGHTLAACNKLLVFNRAAGHVMAGLTSRRQRERAYCMEGL